MPVGQLTVKVFPKKLPDSAKKPAAKAVARKSAKNAPKKNQ